MIAGLWRTGKSGRKREEKVVDIYGIEQDHLTIKYPLYDANRQCRGVEDVPSLSLRLKRKTSCSTMFTQRLNPAKL